MTIRQRPGAETLQTNDTVRAQREAKVSGVRPSLRSSQRILIVDANSDALAFMAFALRRHGHAVVLADGVQSAVTAASIQSFDVVITNLALRDGTGMTLLKMLQEKSRIRGIALSEDGCDDNVVLDAGFEFKLQKPVPIATLTHAVLALGT
ncbi:MAG: multi-sensor hybrid histidine kinase [Myxococcaceae bacterium]|nr:multi-sensor hybrid histidine kinase [Myxococcaceae bacterium]